MPCRNMGVIGARKGAGGRNCKQVMRKSLTEKMRFEYRIKGGDNVGQVEVYNGPSYSSDWLDSERRQQIERIGLVVD